MSKRSRKPRAPKTLYDKVKEFDENFAVTIMTATEEDMKSKLLNIAAEDEKYSKAKATDPDIISLSGQLKVANQTYTGPLKQNSLRRKLILETLKDRGRIDLDVEFKTPEA